MNIINYCNQLKISCWNVHGLGDKHKDENFLRYITSDINILLETWKGENQSTQIENYISITKSRKKHKKSRRHSGGIIIYVKKKHIQGNFLFTKRNQI